MAEKTIKFPKNIVNHYIDTLREKIQVNGVFLFGSYAFGKPTKHSDVDLIIIGSYAILWDCFCHSDRTKKYL